MASLAGKADPTIVAAAYRAAVANVPGDYSKYYQAQADIHKGVLEDIESTFKGWELDRKASTKELNDKIKQFFDEPLRAQKIDSDYKSMQRKITGQRKAWEDAGGFKNDPEGLQDWERENEKIIGMAQGDTNSIQVIATGVKDGIHDIKGMNPDDRQLAINITDYWSNTNKKSGTWNEQATTFMKDNPDATPEELWGSLGELDAGTVVKYEDPQTGEHTYISNVAQETSLSLIQGEPPVPKLAVKKSSELAGSFKKKADDAKVATIDKVQEARKRALTTPESYDVFRTQDRNEIEDTLNDIEEKNPNVWRYMYRQKVAGERQSFDDAIRSGTDIGLTKEIIDALGAVNNDDNILDEGDFVNVGNYHTAIEAILDSEIGKSRYLDFVGDAIEKQHDIHKQKPTPKTPTTPKRGQMVIDGVKIDPADAQQKAKAMYQKGGSIEYSSDKKYQFINDGKGGTIVKRLQQLPGEEGKAGVVKYVKIENGNMTTSQAVKFRGLDVVGLEDIYATQYTTGANPTIPIMGSQFTQAKSGNASKFNK